MSEISEDENQTIAEIKAAMSVLSEKLRVGHELSADIHATYDKIVGNSEFLKKYVNQIEKLKENISTAASEIVSGEIAQLSSAYEVLQEDYNKKMSHMRKFMYISLGANVLLLIASVVGIVMSHR